MSDHKVPAGWQGMQLSQLGRIVSRGTPKSDNSAFWYGNIRWATPTDITRLYGSYISTTERAITQEGLTASAATLLPKGAVLVCTRATIGDCAIAAEPLATNQGFKSIVPDLRVICSEFLYYGLRRLKPTLQKLANSSTFAEISKSEFAKIELAVPPLSEQRRIAEIIATWDGAIETNAQILSRAQKKLALAREILLSDMGLESAPLCDYNEVTTGQAAPQEPDAFGSDGYPFIRAGNLDRCIETNSEQECAHIGEKSAKAHRLRLFPTRTIIFAKSGMSARLARVHMLTQPCYLVSHLAAILPSNQIHSEYLFAWFEHNPPARLIQGEGFPSIRTSDIGALRIPLPAFGEQRAIGETLSDLRRSVYLRIKLINTLCRQRNALASELLTGRLRVRDAERLVAAAG